MKTLRRELIKKIEGVVLPSFSSMNKDPNGSDNKFLLRLCERIADSVLELRGFQDKPAFDMSKAGIEWNILASAEVRQESLDKWALEKETVNAFESAFSIKGNWNWYPAKPQETRVWADFRARLIKIYVADKDAFTKYVTWIAQPYSRGTMTGLQIKRNPQDFPDAWASFCMGTGYKPPRQIVSDSERTDLDEDGAPISYM